MQGCGTSLLGVMRIQARGKEKKPGALGQKVLVGYPSLALTCPAAAPLAPDVSGGYIPAACRATKPEKYPVAAAKIKLEWKSRNKYLGESFLFTPELELSLLFSGRGLSPAPGPLPPQEVTKTVLGRKMGLLPGETLKTASE